MPNVPLSAETKRRLETLFAEPDWVTATRILVTRCGDNLPFDEGSDEQGLERIRFAALKVSNGDLGELERVVEMAGIDSRDVLMAAGFGQDVDAHRRWLPAPRRHQPPR